MKEADRVENTYIELQSENHVGSMMTYDYCIYEAQSEKKLMFGVLAKS